MATRGRPAGQPKTGGRVAGSLDRGARQLVTAQMAGDILSVYDRLGGVDFLFHWAKENKTAFVVNVLQKLMPAAPKDDEAGGTYNTQINVGQISDFEAARRIAFCLSKAAYENGLVPVAETTYTVPGWTPPDDVPDMPEPQPCSEPLERKTHEAGIADYTGRPGEQGGSTVRSQSATTKLTVKELHQRMRNRRELL